MYGLAIPAYAKRLEKQWQNYDRYLRLRYSLDFPGLYILERKVQGGLDWPEDLVTRGTDRAVQLSQQYRMVGRIKPQHLCSVSDMLRAMSIQARGGAATVADMLDEQDRSERDSRDRVDHTLNEAKASQMYDRIAWLERRRVAMGGHGLTRDSH